MAVLKRAAWLLLTAVLILSSASATVSQRIGSETPDWPELNEEGFLDEGEFVYEGEDEGLWRYVSPTLRIEISRKTKDTPKKLVWWEAEIWTRGEEGWINPTYKEGKYLSTSTWPYLLAQQHKVVFAINNDFAQGRYPSKNANVGIIIRNGKILWSKVRKNQRGGAFPNQDILAFMPDGSIAVFDRLEHTAQEYIDMGCKTVMSFGPWLIRDGVINETALSKLGLNNNPRTVIGMVDPHHFVAIVAEGRTARSKGTNLMFLTERLLEMGCTVGFNLDGGETSFMMFMGVQLNVAGGATNKVGSARRATELIAIGVSDLVIERKPAVIKK